MVAFRLIQVFKRAFIAPYFVALRQLSVTYVLVSSLKFSSRFSSGTRLPTQTSLNAHSPRHTLSRCGNFHHKEFIMYTAFTPGAPWLDTDGKRIQAHGGQIFQENGTDRKSVV